MIEPGRFTLTLTVRSGGGVITVTSLASSSLSMRRRRGCRGAAAGSLDDPPPTWKDNPKRSSLLDDGASFAVGSTYCDIRQRASAKTAASRQSWCRDRE